MPAGVAHDPVLDDGLDRPRRRDRVEVRAEEERRALLARARAGGRGCSRSSEPIVGAGVVLVGRQPDVGELGEHAVGDGTLLARRARDRGELEEEAEDVAQRAASTATAGARPRALEGRADEPAEERGRPRRARLELRVELARDEPGMVGQLDDLDEPPLLERAGDDEPVRDELFAVLVVHLVAVPVALVDRRLAVDLARARLLAELDGLRPEPHRAAEVLDLLLLGQQVDHRVRRLGIHLRRVRALEPAHVPRELGDGDVHAEADAEVRDALLAGDAAGEDLALPAARAEAARHEHAVRRLELLDRLLVGHVLGVEPAHVAPSPRGACPHA